MKIKEIDKFIDLEVELIDSDGDIHRGFLEKRDNYTSPFAGLIKVIYFFDAGDYSIYFRPSHIVKIKEVK